MGYYCDADDVSSFLQITAFSSTTTPTDNVVEDIIGRKEDIINRRTSNSWKPVKVTNLYLSPTTDYISGEGIRVDLPFRNIKTLSTSAGDKVEIWNGSQWVDYVVSKTEDRNNDFWVNYSDGILFIKDRTLIDNNGIRLTFRYGEDKVPADISDLCIKMVAIDILTTYEQVLNFADDGVNTKPSTQYRIENLQKQVDSMLNDLIEMRMVN